MAFDSQEGHVGSALSCADALTVLYFGILNIDPKNPLSGNRDRFVLSKGHAVSALYAVLAERGFFEKKCLDGYCKDGTKMAGHSTKQSFPGVEVSTGALGHGLPMACGMAIADKKDKKKNKTFVMISDGECDEGTTWESALFAAHHKLDNLVVIIDYNKWQAFGRTKDVLNLEPLAEKWQAFGWQTKEVAGHNFEELEKHFLTVPLKKDLPTVIILNTKKGAGVSFLEDKLESHYKHLTKEDFQKACEELS